MVRICPISIQVENGIENVRYAAISPPSESTSPSRCNTMNSGMNSKDGGSRYATTISRATAARPANRMRAIANAPIAPAAAAISVVTAATITLLRMNTGNAVWNSTVAY